jgi:hypothetical protein
MVLVKFSMLFCRGSFLSASSVGERERRIHESPISASPHIRKKRKICRNLCRRIEEEAQFGTKWERRAGHAKQMRTEQVIDTVLGKLSIGHKDKCCFVI